MTNKKLGLLLCPLLPLTAIGIVEVASAVASLNEPRAVAIVEVREPVPPPSVHFAAPPAPSLPAPDPVPEPIGPRTVTSD